MQGKHNRGSWDWQSFLRVLIPFAAIAAIAQDASPRDVTAPNRAIIVSLPDRQLVVVADGKPVASFPVAIGAPDSPSPAGAFRIANRIANPTYYHPGSVIPSGKNNPLGTRWLGLSLKGYGIHGTNAPRSVGRAASHGCIRLRNRDMERLFSMMRIGDRVEIHSERDETVAKLFGDGQRQTLAALPMSAPDGGQ